MRRDDMSTEKTIEAGRSPRLMHTLKKCGWMLVVGIASVGKFMFIIFDAFMMSGRENSDEEESYYQKSARMQLDDVYNHNLYHGEDIYDNDNLN